MKIRTIIIVFVLLVIEACSVYNGSILNEKNPCFYFDNKGYLLECNQWRDKYPEEYNRFYFKVKENYPDSMWNRLPEPVDIIMKKNKFN